MKRVKVRLDSKWGHWIVTCPRCWRGNPLTYCSDFAWILAFADRHARTHRKDQPND